MVSSIREDHEGTPTISVPELLGDALMDNDSLILKYLFAHGGTQDDRFCCSLVHLLATQNLHDHLQQLIVSDIAKTAERAFVLSGNGLAPILAVTFLKMCMRTFLEQTLAPLLTEVMATVKKKKGKELSKKAIVQVAKPFFHNVLAHETLLPLEVDMILGCITKAVESKFPGHGADAALSFFCFRVLASAVASHRVPNTPELFAGHHRATGSIAKIIQHIYTTQLPSTVQTALKPFRSLFKEFSGPLREKLLHRISNGQHLESFAPTLLPGVAEKALCTPPCRCFVAVEYSQQSLHDAAQLVAGRLRAVGHGFFKDAAAPADAAEASLPPREGLEARLLHARVHWGNTETFCRAVESVLMTDGLRLLQSLGSSVTPKLANDSLLLACLNGSGAMMVASYVTGLRGQGACSCCFLFADCPSSRFGFELFMRHFLLVSSDWISAAFVNFFPDNDSDADAFALASAGLSGLAMTSRHAGIALSAAALKFYMHLIKASKGVRAVQLLFVVSIDSFLAQACCTPKQRSARDLLIGALHGLIGGRVPPVSLRAPVAQLCGEHGDALQPLLGRLVGEGDLGYLVAEAETHATGDCSVTKRLKAANHVCDRLLLAVRLSTCATPSTSSASLPFSFTNMQRVLFALDVVDRIGCSAPLSDPAPATSWLRDDVSIPECLQVTTV